MHQLVQAIDFRDLDKPRRWRRSLPVCRQRLSARWAKFKYCKLRSAFDDVVLVTGVTKRLVILITCIVGALLASAPAAAQETVTYSYDALGRLIVSTVSGGPANGTQTGTTFDAAGNRAAYAVSNVPVPPTFAISNAAAVTEGGVLQFTVTKTGATATSFTINYATADGSALSGSDYTPVSGTLTFLAAETTKTISIATIDDTTVEPSEIMSVSLSAPTRGATITNPTANGTITDNDVDPTYLSIGNASVTEGGTLAFTVTRTGNTAIAASANYATSNGTAIAGSDYNAAAGTVSFAANQSTATINVSTIDDMTVESAETLTVTLSAPSANTNIINATGTGTINDNDVYPANLSIGNASATEGGTLAFIVTRSGNTAIAASASYTTSNGSAGAGSDYNAVSGTVSFAPNQTTATINVATIDDTIVEPTETMTVTLSGPAANTMIAVATGTGTINDNDVNPASLVIGNASVAEGGTLVFTVTRSGNTAIAVSASYATSNGSAIAGSDYNAASGTVSFAANQTAATINVATIDDTVVEATETMTVALSAPSANANITTANGTGTITDNDVNPANLAIGNASVTEGGTLVFNVARSGNTAIAASAHYATRNGTAYSGNDYTATSGTVSFAPNQTSATISVVTIDNISAEPNRTMTVTLSAPAASTAITTATGTGEIIDDEPHNMTILTDGDFNVLPDYQDTYRCGYTKNLAFSVCVLVQTSIYVYDESLPNPYDPHYSMDQALRLRVETVYFGSGVAP